MKIYIMRHKNESFEQAKARYEAKPTTFVSNSVEYNGIKITEGRGRWFIGHLGFASVEEAKGAVDRGVK